MAEREGKSTTLGSASSLSASKESGDGSMTRTNTLPSLRNGSEAHQKEKVLSRTSSEGKGLSSSSQRWALLRHATLSRPPGTEIGHSARQLVTTESAWELRLAGGGRNTRLARRHLAEARAQYIAAGGGSTRSLRSTAGGPGTPGHGRVVASWEHAADLEIGGLASDEETERDTAPLHARVARSGGVGAKGDAETVASIARDSDLPAYLVQEIPQVGPPGKFAAGQRKGKCCCGRAVWRRIREHARHSCADSPASAFQATVGHAMEEGFEELGGLTARHPYATLLCWLAISIPLAIFGVVSLADEAYRETQADKLWLQQDSRADVDAVLYEEWLERPLEASFTYWVPGEGADALQPSVVSEMWALTKFLTQGNVRGADGITYNYTSLCSTGTAERAEGETCYPWSLVNYWMRLYQEGEWQDRLSIDIATGRSALLATINDQYRPSGAEDEADEGSLPQEQEEIEPPQRRRAQLALSPTSGEAVRHSLVLGGVTLREEEISVGDACRRPLPWEDPADVPGCTPGSRTVTAPEEVYVASRVAAIRTIFLLHRDNDDTALRDWMTGFLQAVQSTAEAAGGVAASDAISLVRSTSYSLDDETAATQLNTFAATAVVSVSIVAVLLMVMLSEPSLVRSRVVLSLAGLGVIALACAMGLGIAFLLGARFTPVTGAVAYLALGLGVDLIISLSTSFNVSDSSTPIESRNRFTLAHAGPGAAATTAMSVAAFASGAASAFPAISMFAIVAACVLASNFVLLVTLFNALMVLDQRRIYDNRYDVCCCARAPGKARHVSHKPPLVRVLIPMEVRWSAGIIGDFCARFYAPLLRRKSVRIAVLVIAALLTGGAGWLAADGVNVGLPLQDLVAEDSYYHQYREADALFPSSAGAVVILPGEPFEQFDKVRAVVDEFMKLGNVVVSSPLTRHPETPTSRQELYQWFRTGETEAPNTDLFRSQAGTGPARALKFTVLQNWPVEPSTQDEITLMENMRAIIDASDIHGAVVFDETFFSLTSSGALPAETYSKLLKSGLIEVGVLLVFVHPLAAVLIALLMPAVDVCVLGFMWLTNMTLNTVTVICLVLSVGLTVDWMAHVAHAFQEETGKKSVRAADAVSTMSSPLLSGAIALLLSLLALGIAPAAFARQFFFMVLGVAAVGLVFALTVLPALLAFVGPDPLGSGHGHDSDGPAAGHESPAHAAPASGTSHDKDTASITSAASKRGTRISRKQVVPSAASIGAIEVEDEDDGDDDDNSNSNGDDFPVTAHSRESKLRQRKSSTATSRSSGPTPAAAFGNGIASLAVVPPQAAEGPFWFGFDSLVLAGGGTQALAHAGALAVLEEYGARDQIKRVSGTNLSALTAFLFAVGASAREICEVIRHCDMSLLVNERSSVIEAALRRAGVHHRVRNLSEGVRLMGLVRNAAELYCGTPDLTFRQLYRMKGIELCIVVTNMASSQAEYLHVKTSPDLPIFRAVRAACTIPGVMRPLKLADSGDEYADGGLLANFAMRCWDGWWLSLKDRDSYFTRLRGLNADTTVLNDEKRFGERRHPGTLGVALVSPTMGRSDPTQYWVRKGGGAPTRPDTALTQQIAAQEAELAEARRLREAALGDVLDESRALLSGNIVGRESTTTSVGQSHTTLEERRLAAADEFLDACAAVDADGESALDADKVRRMISDALLTKDQLQDLFGTLDPSGIIVRLRKDARTGSRRRAKFSDVYRYLISIGVCAPAVPASVVVGDPLLSTKKHVRAEDHVGTRGGGLGSLLAGPQQVSVSDQERVVAIDCDYVPAMTWDMDVQDVDFLIESGARAMSAFLRQRGAPPLSKLYATDGT